VLQALSWSSSPLVSASSQPSTALPDSIRKISIHVVVTTRPLAATPMKALACPSICPTYHYAVSLRDNILYRCGEVRKGRAVSGHTAGIVVGTLYCKIQRVGADDCSARNAFNCAGSPLFQTSWKKRRAATLLSSSDIIHSSLFPVGPMWSSC
jgi:hypothetical protein